jgi:phage tail-like protein
MPAKQELTNPAIWFKLTIDHREVGYFTEVSGLNAEIEVMSYNEGGRNNYVHKLPTRMKHPNLVLKRGVSRTKDLQDWFQDCWQGPTRKAVSLTMINEAGTSIRGWSFAQAFPVKWTGPQFNAGQATAATEAIEIAHDGLIVEAV